MYGSLYEFLYLYCPQLTEGRTRYTSRVDRGFLPSNHRQSWMGRTKKVNRIHTVLSANYNRICYQSLTFRADWKTKVLAKKKQTCFVYK